MQVNTIDLDIVKNLSGGIDGHGRTVLSEVRMEPLAFLPSATMPMPNPGLIVPRFSTPHL
jgi:hypothetical protein